ncbi:hypothetical protein IFM89_033131 [Coptis chinensis]|uniref:FAR1 domain-containing protein n=1 Tax=Coptis chinensis TaxID=261450 RepID=A0A835HL90_9MAGN|nr:hypothetical protein IFM89_033131 [Coptis chinensis]
MIENEQAEWGDVCEDDEPHGGVIGDEVYEIEKDMNIYCPCEGMEFDSLEEADVFYNNYAGHIGFSVRKNTVNRSRVTREINGRTFCCSFEGMRDSRAKRFEERKRNKADTRTGCKAMMVVRKKKR